MKPPGSVTTGRTDTRRLCESCRQRVKLGAPRESEAWTARLQLTEEQVDLLLLAAGEWDRLCAAVEGEFTAVEFTDWLRPSVVGRAA